MGKKSREKKYRQAIRRDKYKPQSPIFLFGISLLFFIFGLAPAISEIKDILFWYKMREAIAVSGILKSIDIVGLSSGRGGSSETVVAKYSYVVDGKVYDGSRPSMHTGGDNFGYYQRNLYNQLKRNYDQGLPITVHINPEIPSLSCLDLTIRPSRAIIGILFPFPFFGISLMCLFVSLKAGKANKRLHATAGQGSTLS
ncbi:MAG: DUF3592 domain-containing protein [Desulfobacteraceae bacterium]|nr:MAG: DUF3592 domain-containing protein [Desulfobacteraceae bacterium]